jgi:hypothetical protein
MTMTTEKSGDRDKSVLEDKEKFQSTGDKDHDTGAKKKIAHMGDKPNTPRPSGKPSDPSKPTAQ